jgi:hypothetical protein
VSICDVILRVGQRYALVSCHVERPLDDHVWSAFARFQARHPGGFAVAALMRPPDPAAREDEALWLARARIAAAQGPLGHHTHWGGADQARPVDGDPAERVRSEAAWLRERGLRPQLFGGGGWYMDERVAAVLAELDYIDCTATAFRPRYLAPGASPLALAEPARLRLGQVTLRELPTTHSLGMAVRGLLGPLPRYVHVYFHDTDLLDQRRRAALRGALAVLGRRRRPVGLDELEVGDEVEFSSAASAP